MRFVTYLGEDGPRVGMCDSRGDVFDVGFDGAMRSFIEAGGPVGDKRPVGAVRLLAPLRPRSLRDFMTFEEHLMRAMNRLGRSIPSEWYEVPAYYKGMPDTVIGPDDTVPWPRYIDSLDHELELAAIIGRPGIDIPPNDAGRYIFGYTIWNDFSARDVQARELPIGMGPGKAKDWDGSNALGPCIVTAEDLDVTDLVMAVRVNGEVWGQDSAKNMHHTFGDLIAYASMGEMLYPGEAFGSGTASGGSGLELGRSLVEGDVVELSVEGIGVLRNHIGRKEWGRK